MKELTPEEQMTLKKGQEAIELLKNPAFASTVNELSETITNALLNTDVAEGVKRERLYMIHTALKELVAILQLRVNAKQTIEAQMSEPTENE